MVDEYRGSLRVRAWPKARPGRRHPTNEYWTKWLIAANFLYRYQPAKFQAQLQKLTAGTPYMPRDIFISAMRGRAWTIRDLEGHTYYPMAMRQDISQSLDAIAQLQGQLMYRGPELWTPVPVGTAGQILTLTGSPPQPEWAQNPAQPYMIIPFILGQAADVTIAVNSTSYVTNDRYHFGIDLDTFEPTEFRLQVDGHANAGGQTVDIILAARGTPTVPIGGSSPGITLTDANAVHNQAWTAITTAWTGLPRIGLSFKGSNSTVDAVIQQATIQLR